MFLMLTFGTFGLTPLTTRLRVTSLSLEEVGGLSLSHLLPGVLWVNAPCEALSVGRSRLAV